MHADPRSSAQAPPGPLPLDVFYAVLGQLDDRRDLHAAALVCWAFNRAATPLLYREIDADTRDGQVVHPATTLLARPELARYVHHVRETGVIHMRNPRLTSIALRAIRLCTNIRSFTWSADTSSSPAVFEDFLDALAGTDLRALTLRTYHDLGYQVWSKLNRIAGLTKVVVWSMEGPPRYLQGWAGLLGNTLTELELGRCANVPAGELVSVLAQLPRLRDLRLKGAPSSAMYDILACLPALASLDTEYLGNGNAHAPNAPTMTGPPTPSSSRPPLRSRLRRLTVRTSSVDLQGPKELWDWLPQLIPLPSLEEFTLNAFSTQGYMTVAPRFLQFLRHVHGETLRLFCVNQSQLALPELAHLCAMFPALEELSCAVTSSNASAISGAIAHARVLRTVKLHVFRGRELTIPGFGDNSPAALFSKKDAEALMTRKGSSIRKLSMGRQQFTARWVPTRDRDGESTAELVVEEDKREQGHW